MSFGIQSTVPHVLAGLGRRHTADADGPLHRRRGRPTGFATFNLDLIFGGAGETDADWARTLERHAGRGAPPAPRQRLRPDGRAGDAVGRRPRPVPTTTCGASRTSGPTPCCRPAGYRWEEISNWARPGHGCRHNRLYWEQGDYLGVGAAAHSHRAGRRWWNVRTPERYIAAVWQGRSPEGRPEVLDRAQSPVRGAQPWPLRTPSGVPEGRLARGPRARGSGRPPGRSGGAQRAGPAAGQRGDRPAGPAPPPAGPGRPAGWPGRPVSCGG